MKWLLIGLAVVVLLGVAVLGHRRAIMGPASGLGVRDGRLAGCPATPNCVSSFADDGDHRIESLALEGDPSAAMARLRRVLEQTPRTRVVDATDRYLHAEATSLLWGYVDDLEILIDAEGRQIHFRSASRTGYSDLGVNRRRVRDLVEAFGAADM